MFSMLRAAGLVFTLGVLVAVEGCDRSKPGAAVRLPVRVSPARDAADVTGQRGAAYLATIKGRNQIT